MSVDADRLRRCYATARDALLAERNDAGHWEGELSTSALSTATAVMALEMVRRHQASIGRKPYDSADEPSVSNPGSDHRANAQCSPFDELIANGIAWLATHQNDDGGWGDTTKSISNISTTMLCRASFHATGSDEKHSEVVQKAIRYIDEAGGVEAVLERYGDDRTFSIPILTHCALAGLVEWKHVLPLPFYLACLPPRFYKTVRLPVVSYALPALIAIGQVGYHFRKPWNPISRFVKWLSIKPTLRRLESIQPENGGFLEATPLTSFVTMSLAGMGRADHPVAKKGVEFIINSVRPDGSWPIDTNLATWVTTLSVNALGSSLPEEDRTPIRDWLLDQQYKEVHPYTNADPGGWAWTDLPGGVPDADDTPGAMLAVTELRPPGDIPLSRPSTSPDSYDPIGDMKKDMAFGADLRAKLGSDSANLHAFGWLLDIQNRDGGFPTFCRGWGKLPFDRSSADITAHCLRAMSRFLFGDEVPNEFSMAAWLRENDRVRDRIRDFLIEFEEDAAMLSSIERSDFEPKQEIRAVFRGFEFLDKTQRPDGSWLPLWFGNQHAPNDENPTYGTARVLAAYRDCNRFGTSAAQRGLEWLRANQNDDGGWGGVKGTRSSVEETALAVEILIFDDAAAENVQHGLQWLCDRVEDGTWTDPTPIGFYFAKLWYFERLYPQIFTVAALRRACREFIDRVSAEVSQAIDANQAE